MSYRSAPRPGLANSPFVEGLRNGSNKARAIALMGTAITAGGVVEAYNVANDAMHTSVPSRVFNLKSIDSVGSPVIIKAGANMRSIPYVAQANEGQMSNTVVSPIPSGKELVVEQPMESSQHPGWIAVILPGTNVKSIHSIDGLADRTAWINAEDVRTATPSNSPDAPSMAELNANVDITQDGVIHIQAMTDIKGLADNHIGVSHYQEVR